jgi:formylglycine-generating enzyme required for sulfatase activity
MGNNGGSEPDGSGAWPGATGGTSGTGAAPGGGGGGASADSGVPADMVLIPSATFTMGCTSQTFCYCDEYPSRTIAMSEFYIDRTEVTRERYGQCVAAGACLPAANRA